MLRLAWMFIGNAALLMLLIAIASGDDGLSSLVSVGFWIVVAGIAVARYVDVVRFGGSTPDGLAPATVQDVRHYVARLVVIAGMAWGIAHTI